MTSSPGTPRDANLTTVLAADIGSARTRLSLFTQVAEGRWSVGGTAEAISTAQSPREGVMGGLLTAAHEIEQATGRRLLSRGNSLIIGQGAGQGADALVASSSAAPPLRLITLAATGQHSGVWTTVASRWSYVQVLDRAVRDAGLELGQDQRWADDLHQSGWADVAAKIRLLAPDAVLLTGGYNGADGAATLEIAGAVVAERPSGRAPLTLVFAGNSEVAPRLVRLLAGRADLRICGNVLPSAGVAQPAPAGEALDDLYCQRKLGTLNGYSAAAGLCAAPVMSSARALAMAWTALSELRDAPVLGFDVGASATVAGLAMPGGAYQMNVEPALGIGRGWDNPQYGIDTAAIARWIPIPLSKTEIQTRLAARQTTFSVPQGHDALLFQEALAREAWRATIAGTGENLRLPATANKPLNIIGSGGVVIHTPSLWRVALMLLDAAEPHGMAHLWADTAGILPQVGALAAINRQAAMSLLRGNGLCHLGLAICLDGSTTPGSKAADIEIALADGSVRRTIAAWGSLHLLHTAGLGNVTVAIQPVRGVYIGDSDERARITVSVSDGDLGVILDCRGRPLADRLDPDHCYARMRSWIAAGDH